jgi:hypothetical protein
VETAEAGLGVSFRLAHRLTEILDIEPAERLQRSENIVILDTSGFDVVLSETFLIHGLYAVARHGPLPA